MSSDSRIYSFQSEPNALVFRVSAELLDSKYTWLNTNKVAALPQVDIDETDLWFINAFQFSADVDELEFQTAIDAAGDQIPVFRLYQDASNKTPILQQQLVLANFYERVPYRKFIRPRAVAGKRGQKAINQLRGSFQGVLQHLPTLIGKTEINLIFTLFIQDVRNSEVQRQLATEYGGLAKGGRTL